MLVLSCVQLSLTSATCEEPISCVQGYDASTGQWWKLAVWSEHIDMTILLTCIKSKNQVRRFIPFNI